METNLRQNVAGGIIVFFVFPVFISELFGFKWFGRNDINLFECFVLVFNPNRKQKCVIAQCDIRA